jgi:hypothetical protein
MLTVIHLKQGETLLGLLRVQGSDFPWTQCTFEPTPAFEAVRPLFEHELRVLESRDMDAWSEAYRAIVDLNLNLIDPHTGTEVGEGDFLLHINGNSARLRY